MFKELDEICASSRNGKRTLHEKKATITAFVEAGRRLVSYFPEMQPAFFSSSRKSDELAHKVFRVYKAYITKLIDLDNEFVVLARRYYRTESEKKKAIIEAAVEHAEEPSAMEALNNRIDLLNRVSRKGGETLIRMDLQSCRDKIL